MKKKSKKPTTWIKKKTAVIAVLIAGAVTIGAVLGAHKLYYYNDAANQASLVQIRELILLAVRGLKKDAPVEPRTGDVYFPEHRLYLPNPGIPLTITYLDDTGDVTDAQSELSISTYPVRGTTGLYTARNTEALFAAVPKLQSCSRGIKVVSEKFPADDTQNQLKHTVALDNGKTAYIYLEKDCPELASLADIFKDVRSY